MAYIHELRALVGHRPLILPGSVVLVLDACDRVLLQRRTDGGRWCVPGGLMEPGESLEETAQREVLEETGLVVHDLEFVTVLSGAKFHAVLNNGDEFYAVSAVFLTRAFSGSLVSSNDESLDLQFFALAEVPQNVAGSVTKACLQLLRGRLLG